MSFATARLASCDFHTELPQARSTRRNDWVWCVQQPHYICSLDFLLSANCIIKYSACAFQLLCIQSVCASVCQFLHHFVCKMYVLCMNSLRELHKLLHSCCWITAASFIYRGKGWETATTALMPLIPSAPFPLFLFLFPLFYLALSLSFFHSLSLAVSQLACLPITDTFLEWQSEPSLRRYKINVLKRVNWVSESCDWRRAFLFSYSRVIFALVTRG